MEEEAFIKVNFADYEGKYNEKIKEQMEKSPESIDVETMRAALYGYTFTNEYKDMAVADELFMDYWKEKYEEKLWDEDDDDCEDGKDDEDQDLDLEDIFSDMDNYEVDTPQERLLLQTIDSTGDGKTPETALCVIDVHQEYEYMSRVFPYSMLKVKQQSLLPGYIDCIEFENPFGDVKCIYFDISRKFEK